ncbi:MAG: hypothetical protein ACR2MW_03040 [Chthoniobacterales bacterium]
MTKKTLSALRARCKTQIRKSRGPLRIFFGLLLLTVLASCVAVPATPRVSRRAHAQQIANEEPGDYFVGRRYFKGNYRFWGYVRRPGQPWSTAVLVMLNENKKLAPDRSQLGPGTDQSYEGHVGFDNDYEYRLEGYFSGDKVYELVSNRVYPEFVLTGYQLRSTHPAPIFPSQLDRRPAGALVIEKPE